MSSVTAIIPNWNGAKRLERTLASLAAQSLAPAQTLVVDNASTDHSRSVAARFHTQILRLDQNYGFAHAVNRGVQLASTPWVAIINNDVVLDPAFLENLLAAAEAHQAPFAAPLIFSLHEPHLLDGSLDLLTRAALPWRAGHGAPLHPALQTLQPLTLAPFTALLLRRDLFLALGGLDERLESYLEDVDFSLRAALAGHRGLLVPSALAHHEASSTLGPWSPRMVRLLARNQLLLVAKHFPQNWPLAFGRQVLLGQLLWGLLALRRRRLLPWLAGKLDALRLFSSFRPASTPRENPALETLLAQNEKQILQLQHQLGQDPFWRWYFLLAGVPA